MRAVVVDPHAPGRLALSDVDQPVPGPSDALVRVAAISLNRGEIRAASTAEAGWRPGWDLAGTVEQQAADGSGPAEGSRVVGFVDSGAWDELAAVPTNRLAELPDSVSFAHAATLPVAGLTALRVLERGGSLLGRSVLVTGASGGVGHFACQLARLSGARVVGVVRQAASEAAVREAGAHEVVVGQDLSGAEAFGPYHLIAESVGGQSLAQALTMLARDGVCVVFGATGGTESTIDVRKLYNTGGASVYGFAIFHEHKRNPVAGDLSRLAQLVAEGRLRAPIEVEAPWTEVGTIAQQLMDRRFTGKAVLHISE
jgi:NADPH:quinone reductase-like Zn-dependent oxidoreductase